MQTKDIIGKTITNIYARVNMEVGGLDKAECFIELDYHIIIDIPFGLNDEIWIKELNKNAVSLFENFSNYAVYQVNDNHKTVGEIDNNYQQQRGSIFRKLLSILLGNRKEYKPLKADVQENNLKHIKDRTITNFLCFDDPGEKGFIMLDNGYLISETSIAPHGTGLAGLNLYENLNQLIHTKGINYYKLGD